MIPARRLPVRAPGEALGLLSGVKVLDLTTSIAGPYATMLLGDMGADVVKVERPRTGDDARHWGPPFLGGQSLWFLSVNRNKRSMALDYGTPQGLEVLRGLVGRSDVVVTNHLPRVQRKLGIDHESLTAVRPDLVFVAVTGFGLSGRLRDLPCYDLVAEGVSGVMDLTGEPESPPQKIGTPAADLLAGTDAAFVAVAALLDRARSGRGRVIDVSLVESMTRFLTPRIVAYLGSGEVPRRSGARDSVIAVYRTFQTADGPITLGLGNDNIWRRFWNAVGRPDTALDPRYATNGLRRQARDEIVAEIQAILSTAPRAHWLRLFAEAQVPAGPINRIDEAAGDPHLRDRGLFYAIEAGPVRIPQVATGVHVDGRPCGYRLPPPALGEHSEQVLRGWLGYDDERIARLREEGSIMGTTGAAEAAR